MITPSGVARQVLNEDAIIIDLDGVSYLTTISAAEYAIQKDKGVNLLMKHRGELIKVGRLWPAITGKTIYAHVGLRRYRMAAWQFEEVLSSPGCIAPVLYCPPREMTA